MKVEKKKTASISSISRRTYLDFVIYYSKNKDQMRYPTGVKVLKSHITKKGEISSVHPTYDHDISILNGLKSRADKIISDFFDKHALNPDPEYIEAEMNRPAEVKQKSYQGIIDYIDDYVDFKTNNRENKKSLSIYESMLDAFEQYQKYLNVEREKRNRIPTVIKFSELDQDFFNNFTVFLLIEKIDQRTVSNGKKGLTNPTVMKRFETFNGFIGYCIKERGIEINDVIIGEYIKKAKENYEVKGYEKDYVTLSESEIGHLYNKFVIEKIPELLGDRKEFNRKEFQTEALTKYRDVLIYSCLQGTRISDTKTMKELHVKSGKKRAQKTQTTFIVEIHDIALEILKKYDYNLHVIEQHYNKGLKILMEAFYKWYKPLYEDKYKREYSLTFVTYDKWGSFREEEIEVPIWQEISSHTGRRTYLSLMYSPKKNLNLKEVMKRVGHKKVETSLRYIHTHQDNQVDYSNIININID